MLTVDQYDQIRRRVLVDGESRRKVARELGHSRKTITKALQYSSPPGYRIEGSRSRPVISPYMSLIDQWIESDKTRPRKQRHTAQRMYERLVDEHAYSGSAVTVRRYVKEAKGFPGEVFYPLQFDPGQEVQVDWGQAQVILNGQATTVHLFCMRLCHSGASFVRAYAREKQECFLDGHVHGFSFFKGVPRRCAYDNLKSAVITVKKGRARDLNTSFKRLRNHYLFQTRFCNVARGNEKGHVENLVKYAQRTFLTPIPEVTDLDMLNQTLLEGCHRAIDRPEAGKIGRRRERFEEEQKTLLPLPDDPFDPCIDVSTIVTKQALVRFDRNDYSVPVSYAHRPCIIRGYAERVEIVVQRQRVATHRRTYDVSQYILDPMHYLPLLKRKPGGLDDARPFKGNPWGDGFDVMRRELEYRYGHEGTGKFIRILLLIQRYPIDKVRSAVKSCIHQCTWSEDAVQHALNDTLTPRSGPLDLSHRPILLEVGSGIRPAGIYEQLMKKEDIQ